jgi:hypothetical protein
VRRDGDSVDRRCDGGDVVEMAGKRRKWRLLSP